MHFVDLKRRFHELTDAEQEDTELLVALSAYEFGPAIGWPELLEHARVIVLAEAGAGKRGRWKSRQNTSKKKDVLPSSCHWTTLIGNLLLTFSRHSTKRGSKHGKRTAERCRGFFSTRWMS